MLPPRLAGIPLDCLIFFKNLIEKLEKLPLQFCDRSSAAWNFWDVKLASYSPVLLNKQRHNRHLASAIGSFIVQIADIDFSSWPIHSSTLLSHQLWRKFTKGSNWATWWIVDHLTIVNHSQVFRPMISRRRFSGNLYSYKLQEEIILLRIIQKPAMCMIIYGSKLSIRYCSLFLFRRYSIQFFELQHVCP